MNSIQAERLYGLGQQTVARLNTIFCRHGCIRRVVLYGSRARQSHTNGSDIDLCLDAPGLDISELSAIATEIDDLLLPWKTDLAHWQKVDDPPLRAAIERDATEIYSRRQCHEEE